MLIQSGKIGFIQKFSTSIHKTAEVFHIDVDNSVENWG